MFVPGNRTNEALYIYRSNSGFDDNPQALDFINTRAVEVGAEKIASTMAQIINMSIMS